MKGFKAYLKEIKNPVVSTSNFKKWFGKSKVVDKSGKPLVVYHGTDSVFKEFSKKKIGSNFKLDSIGFFFTSNSRTAQTSRKSYPNKPAYKFTDNDKFLANSGSVIPVFLKIDNPLTINDLPDFDYNSGLSPTNLFDQNRDMVAKALVNGSYDGFILRSEGDVLCIAINPNQIKSAIGNNGDFSNKSNNITEKLS